MFYWHFLTFIGLTLARKTKGLSLWMLFLKQKKIFFFFTRHSCLSTFYKERLCERGEHQPSSGYWVSTKVGCIFFSRSGVHPEKRPKLAEKPSRANSTVHYMKPDRFESVSIQRRQVGGSSVAPGGRVGLASKCDGAVDVLAAANPTQPNLT